MIRLDRMRLLRRQIDRDLHALQEWGKTISERGELVRGSVYERQKRCGKAGCRCEQGALHSGPVMTIRQQGQSKWVSARERDVTEMKNLIEGYRRFREAKRQMRHLFEGIMNATDELGQLREREG